MNLAALRLGYRATAAFTAVVLLFPVVPSTASAQTRKPTRAASPKFEPGQFEGVFFDDAAKQITGRLPAAASSSGMASTQGAPTAAPGSNGNKVDPPANVWSKLISPGSLEDLIKGGKLRLDRIVTTPAAFKGGGFIEARKEFSLMALLFAIVEVYPNDVRWKSSATVARERFARTAANLKISSDAVYQETKQRLLDLGDLVGGSSLDSSEPKSDANWSELIDRTPLMHLLEWSQAENLNKMVSSESEFKSNADAIRRYAELISILGQVALAEEMPDANDDDYQAFSKAMIGHAQQIVLAVQSSNAELARTAAGQLGQSCAACHDSYR